MYVPNTQAEKDAVGTSSYVTSVAGSWYVWIGCTDNVVEGSYQCDDGTTLDGSRKHHQFQLLGLIPLSSPSRSQSHARQFLHKKKSGTYPVTATKIP